MRSETIRDVACTLCGCVCDDLSVQVAASRIAGIAPRCALAEPWFAAQTTGEGLVAAAVSGASGFCGRRRARGGRHIGFGTRAAHLWTLAQQHTRPEVCGTTGRYAGRHDRHHGVDVPCAFHHRGAGRGGIHGDAGRIKNRSDLVMYWGSDPLVSHPRHIERLVEAPGLFVPAGRRGRHLVVVDVAATRDCPAAPIRLSM